MGGGDLRIATPQIIYTFAITAYTFCMTPKKGVGPLPANLKIMYDQTQYSPIWFQDRAGLWINEASYFAMRDLSGYAPAGWITYTQNNPASCFFGAFPEASLEEEAGVGFATFSDPLFVEQFETAITDAYARTKQMHDRYFADIHKREQALIIKNPVLLAQFIRDVRSLTTFIMSHYLQTQPQRFWQFERTLADHLPHADLELLSSTGRRLTHLGTIDSHLTECAHHFAEQRRAPETLFSDTSVFETTLKGEVERYGFLFWGLMGGEYIDPSHAQSRIDTLINNPNFLNSERTKFIDLEIRTKTRMQLLEKEISDLYRYADIMGHVSVMRFDLQTYMLCVLKYVDTITTALRAHYQLDEVNLKSYTTDEILALIEAGTLVNIATLAERQNGFLSIYNHDGVSHHSGEKATILIAPLLAKRAHEIESTQSVTGTVASWPDRNVPALEGRAFVLTSAFANEEQLADFIEGDILIATQTHPHLVPYMKKAGVIVTDEGGITCHAAIVSRELKKPCLIGTRLGSKVFTTGQTVVVNLETASLYCKLP